MDQGEANMGAAAPKARACVYFFAGSPFHRTDGCHARALETLAFVADVYDEVYFQSFEDHPLWPWTEAHRTELADRWPHVRLELRGWGVLRPLVTRFKNLAVRLAPQGARAITSMPALTGTFPAHAGADLFMNYADGFTQLPQPPRTGRVLLDTHDIAHQAYAIDRGLALSDPAVRAQARKEFALTGLADDVIAISRSEANAFRAALPAKRVWHLPPAYAPQVNPAGGGAALLFVGSANDKNARGITGFINEASAWRDPPPLIVAGKVGAMLPAAAAHAPFVSVRGYVDDIGALYGEAAAAICPVKGTGLNIKILEALSYGVPVLADPAALDALPAGYERCVLPLTEDNVRALLGDDALRQNAREAARAYLLSDAFSGPWRAFRASLLGGAPASSAATP